MTIDRPMDLGPRYWAALSVASVFGATGGDVLSHDLGLGHWRGVPVLLLLGVVVVLLCVAGMYLVATRSQSRNERRARINRPVTTAREART